MYTRIIRCNDFFKIHKTNYCTSCTERAVPIRVPRPIVRVTTRNAAIAAVVQITPNPSSANTGGRRIAVEASSQTPYNPKNQIILFASKIKKERGLAAPLATQFTPLNPLSQVHRESRSNTRPKAHSTSHDTKRRHGRRGSDYPKPKQREHRRPPDSS